MASTIVESGRAASFLKGGGEMGALIRAHDWPATPLGRPESWPQSLKTTTGLMLNTEHPMFVFWGPEHLCFYNDGYRPSLGPEKHPTMLGAKGKIVWAEIWDIIGPQIGQVMAGEGATWHENQLVPIVRHGRLDEVYWTYSYSPIHDEAAPNGVGGVLVICNETTDAVLSRRALAESEARFRAYANSTPAPVWVTDKNGAMIFANDQFKEDTGKADADVRGSGWIALIHKDDVADVAARRAAAWEAGHRSYSFTARFRHHDGQWRWLEALARARFDEAGGFQGYVGLAVDRTDAIEAQKELAESERRFSLLTNLAPAIIFFTDRDGKVEFLNQRWFDYTGQSEQHSGLRDWEKAVHPDDYGKGADVWRDPAARRADYELRYRRADGAYRWHLVRLEPLIDDRGEVSGWFGAGIDIHELKQGEEHRKLLIDELNHRVKNTLAIVQGLAFQTFRGADAAPEARKAFEGRLSALAGAHNLLTESNWSFADLKSTAAAAMTGCTAAEAVSIDGPAVALSPKQAVSFAMALHELCTNATKYGALSVAGAKVSITWRIDGETDPPTLRLVWRETEGPPVSQPTKRGFGVRLIEQTLAADIGGQARIDFHEGGVVCVIETPLAPGSAHR